MVERLLVIEERFKETTEVETTAFLGVSEMNVEVLEIIVPVVEV